MCILHFVYPFSCWGHLDFPHVLAIENNAAVNVGVKSNCVRPFTSSGYTSGSGVAALLCIPTSNASGFQFLTSSPTLVIFWFFFFSHNSHSSRSELALIVVLVCISLMTNNVEYVFICKLAICISSLKKYIQVFCPFFLNFIFYWSIIDLQYHISFWYTA